MNADEIVNALRENAEWCDANEYDVPLCMGDNQRAAADLIESLQAQLAESQRREQAAVELIGKVSLAVEVAFNATDYGIRHHVKPNTGIWHTLGLALDWIKAWRGPQEAGEGGQDGD